MDLRGKMHGTSISLVTNLRAEHYFIIGRIVKNIDHRLINLSGEVRASSIALWGMFNPIAHKANAEYCMCQFIIV